MEPNSPLRFDWLSFLEKRWEAQQRDNAQALTPTTRAQTDPERNGKPTNQQVVGSPPRPKLRQSLVLSLVLLALGAMYVFVQDQPASVGSFSEAKFHEGNAPNEFQLSDKFTPLQRAQEVDMILDLALASFKDETRSGNRLILSRVIQELHSRHTNPESDFKRRQNDLVEMNQALDTLVDHAKDWEISNARSALASGDTTKSEALWKRILSSDNQIHYDAEFKSEAAVHLGEIYIYEFKWLEGANNFRLAAYLSPTNANLARAGAFLWKIGDYSGAEHYEREVVKTVRENSAADSDELAGALSSLGVTLAALGKFGEAEQLYLEALSIRRTILAPDASALMRTVNNYCNTLIALNRLDDAKNLCNEALSVRRSQKDKNPYSYAVSLIVSAGLERKLGNLAVAESYLREAADIAYNDTAYWGPKSSRYAQAIYQLGLLLNQNGDHVEAASLVDESVEIVQHLSGELSPDLFIRKSTLSVIRAELGATHEATSLARHAYANLKFLLDDTSHPDVLTAKRNLERVHSLSRLPQ